MTDIVRVDALRFALEAIGHDITDEQAIAVLAKLDGTLSAPVAAPAPIAAGGNINADRYAVARRTGLVTDADQEDIDAELAHQKNGGSTQ